MPDLFGSIFSGDAASSVVVRSFILCVGAALVTGIMYFAAYGKRQYRRRCGDGGRIFARSLPLGAGQRQGDQYDLYGDVFGSYRRCRVYRICGAFHRDNVCYRYDMQLRRSAQERE